MSRKWVLLYLIIVALLSLVITIQYFGKQRQQSLLETIPDNASGILYLPRAMKAHELFNLSSYGTTLAKSDFFGHFFDDIALLDTLLAEAGFDAATLDVKAAIAMLKVQNDLCFVFYADVGKRFPYWEIHERALPVFGNRFELIRRKTSGYASFLLMDRSRNRQINYAFTRGRFVASFNREAFEIAMAALAIKPGNSTGTFKTEVPTTNAIALLILKPSHLAGDVAELFQPNWEKAILRIAEQFDEWIALNLHFKHDELLMDAVLDTNPLWQNVVFDNNILTDSLVRWLPLGTQAFEAVPYAGGVYNGILVTGRVQMQNQLPWFSVMLPDAPAALFDEFFDGRSFVVSPWNNNWSAPFEVRQDVLGLFPDVAFPESDDVFLTTNGSVFLFSTHLALLRNYHNTQSKQLLDRNLASLASLVSARSGVMLYQKLNEAFPWFVKNAANEFRFKLLRNKEAFRAFSSICLQLSSAGTKTYLSLLLKGNAKPIGQALPLWETVLGSSASAPPFFFSDGNVGRVIAFDSAGWMYGFSPEGKLLWKRNTGGIPLGKPVIVQQAQEKKTYFLFNTAEAVFLTNHDGNQAPGFPMRLPSRATSGLAFDPEAEQVFFLNCADRRTYAFTLEGKPAPAWNAPLLSDISVLSPVIIAQPEETMVVVWTYDKELKILDGSGLEQFKLREKIQKAPNASFFANKTNTRGFFLTTGIRGETIYIGRSGTVSIPGPETFSENHYFHYGDFDGDQSPDFLYADGQRAVVYDRFSRKIFEGQLGAQVTHPPLFVQRSDLSPVWAFRFPNLARLVLLSQKTGLLFFDGLPLAEGFCLGTFDGDGPLLLGTCQGKRCMVFSLK